MSIKVVALSIPVALLDGRLAAVCALLVSTLTAIPGAAQSTAAFGEMSSVLRAGDLVRLKTSTGARFDGRFSRVSSEALTLVIDGDTANVPRSTILEVARRRRDLWWNGILIGAAAGATVGLIADVAGSCERRPTTAGFVGDGFCFDFSGYYMPAFAMIGTGVGGLIDLAISRHDTVYRPAVSSGIDRLTVSPVATARLRGVRIASAF